jgi:hypothetical protein
MLSLTKQTKRNEGKQKNAPRGMTFTIHCFLNRQTRKPAGSGEISDYIYMYVRLHQNVNCNSLLNSHDLII